MRDDDDNCVGESIWDLHDRANAYLRGFTAKCAEVSELRAEIYELKMIILHMEAAEMDERYNWYRFQAEMDSLSTEENSDDENIPSV